MSAVDRLIRAHGSARQALLHLGDAELDRMADEEINELFEVAGLGHLFLQLDEPAPKRSRANGGRPKKKTPGRTV